MCVDRFNGTPRYIRTGSPPELLLKARVRLILDANISLNIDEVDEFIYKRHVHVWKTEVRKTRPIKTILD